jgi:hypothetical protein
MDKKAKVVFIKDLVDKINDLRLDRNPVGDLRNGSDQ